MDNGSERDGVMVAHRVDVLIPAFNVAATIEAAVRSILDQTVRDIRVIVVNDGSTDDTGALLAALAQEDPRLLVVSQPNGGIVEALNNGLALCTAPIIARHDGDDLAYPERFEKQLAYLDAHPDCIAVGANVRMIDGAGTPTGKISKMDHYAVGDAAWFPAREPYLIHPLLMIRREALAGIGGYRYVFHAEDADLYWRLRTMGGLHNMPDVLADYRVHAGSVSGASVINGRIQALSSQLAGLSALRCDLGVEDLTFSKERIRAFQQAETIEAMLALTDPELREEERRHVRLATALKMMELASYRPYHLEPTDWRFVRTVTHRERRLLSRENDDEQRQRMIYYIAKMLSQRRLANAVFIAPLGSVAAAMRHIIGERLVRFAHKTLGRSKPFRASEALR